MIYCVDIDGTICTTVANDYSHAEPIPYAIAEINRLFDSGCSIKLFTARGSSSGIDYRILTEQQLEKWGVKYHELIMKKPSYDIIIDDKAISAKNWHLTLHRKVGLIAGSFDLIHPGYVQMFKDSKTVCDYLVVALQDDPTVDRPGVKIKPVQSLEDRKEILLSIRYVDEVVTYTTEASLLEVLKTTKHDIRILGAEYEGSKYNGHELNIPVYFHKREHGYSTTELKFRIRESLRGKKK